MSRMVVLIVCGLLIAPLAFAQTNVLSQNAVGYVKKTLDKGDLYLLDMDFNDIDGNVTYPQDVVGSQLPVGSRLFIWNGSGYDIEQYQAATKTTPEGWAPNTSAIVPGVGFFVQVDAGAPLPSYDLYLLGEVPSAATSDITLEEGLTMTGFPYPASVSWTSTAAAAGAVVGDRLFTWTGSGYDIAQYQAATKTTPEGWSNPSATIEIGQGFFFDRHGPADNCFRSEAVQLGRKKKEKNWRGPCKQQIDAEQVEH